MWKGLGMRYVNNKNRTDLRHFHLINNSPPFANMDRPSIRKMSEQDLPEVMSIEQESFPNPWSLSSFQSELQENELAHYYSLVFQGKVIGYMGYWVIYDEAHITNFAISLQYRSKGWGEYLLRTIMYHCVRTGIARMTLEARVSNEIALRLYHKLGFAAMGVRPRYYSDNQEDALIMWVTL